jgi:threonine dehydrogenase-like Zn-dependent dehydrogenase
VLSTSAPFLYRNYTISLLAIVLLVPPGLLSNGDGNLKAEIASGFGASYVSTSEMTLHEMAEQYGKPDLIIEATGNSGVAFECMQVLGHNGCIVWTSITGGQRDINVPSDSVNLNWVLGNKMLLGSVNANFRHFESGMPTWRSAK